jgi:imidazolonepropionase-like amidohydrolase
VTRTSIINAVVFDGVSADIREHPIHVADGRIVAVDGDAPREARVIDARGGLVTPGLIDAHFHAFGVDLDLRLVESLPSSYLLARGTRRLKDALGRGFTTVRDVAGGDVGLQRAIEEGVLSGPRYLFSGPALSQTGGHGDPRPPEADRDLPSRMTELVDGVDALRKAARERFRAGSHAVKIITSGGVISRSDSIGELQYGPDEIRAVSEEASRHGSYVAAHAYTAEAIVASVSNGVRTIEHGNLLNSYAAAQMAKANAFLVPTLVAYDSMERRGRELGLSSDSLRKNAEVREAGLRSIELARREGVDIGLGTDLMGELEDDQLFEFRIRSEVDSVLDLLRSATSVNAAIIGREDIGKIDEGATADLLLFGGNPFETRDLLWSPSRLVMKAGEVVFE